MSVEDNKALVRGFVAEVINDRRLDRLEEFLAPDYADRSEGLAGSDAIEALRQGFEAWWQSFPDHRVAIEQLVAEGDFVASRASCSAVHAGAYAGHRATGRRISFDAHELYRIHDGRIAEHWEIWDEATLLRQLAAGGDGEPQP